MQRSTTALLCSIHSLFENSLGTFAGTGNQRHDRHAELVSKLLHVDMKAGLAGFIHHVAGKHNRHAHFHHLHCQNQVALQGGRISDVDDGIDHAKGQFAAGDKLFHGVGSQRIGAGNIDKGQLLSLDNLLAFLSVNCHARIVAHVLAGACVMVEQRGFAAVRIAGKSNTELLSCGSRGGRSAFRSIVALAAATLFSSHTPSFDKNRFNGVHEADTLPEPAPCMVRYAGTNLINRWFQTLCPHLVSAGILTKQAGQIPQAGILLRPRLAKIPPRKPKLSKLQRLRQQYSWNGRLVNALCK